MTRDEATNPAENVVESTSVKEDKSEKQPSEVEVDPAISGGDLAEPVPKPEPEPVPKPEPEPEPDTLDVSGHSGSKSEASETSIKSGDEVAKVASKEEAKKEDTEISKDTGVGKPLVDLVVLFWLTCYVEYTVVFFLPSFTPPIHLPNLPPPPPSPPPPHHLLSLSPPSSPPPPPQKKTKVAGSSHGSKSLPGTSERLTIRPRSRSRTSDPKLGVDLAFGSAKLQDLDPVTVGKLFKTAVSKNGDGVALKFKVDGQWNEVTYKEYYEMVINAAKSFITVRIKLNLESSHILVTLLGSGCGARYIPTLCGHKSMAALLCLLFAFFLLIMHWCGIVVLLGLGHTRVCMTSFRSSFLL